MAHGGDLDSPTTSFGSLCRWMYFLWIDTHVFSRREFLFAKMLLEPVQAILSAPVLTLLLKTPCIQHSSSSTGESLVWQAPKTWNPIWAACLPGISLWHKWLWVGHPSYHPLAIRPQSVYLQPLKKKKLWILFGSCEELEWPAIDEISTRSVVFFFSFCKPCVKNAFPPKETSYKGKVKLSYNFMKIGHSILYFLHPPSIQSHPTHWCLIHSHVSLGERLSNNRGTWSKAWHSGWCCLFTLQMLSNSFISMTTGTFADTQALPMGETCCHLLAVSKETRSSGKLVFLGRAESVPQTIRLLFCIGLFAV